MLLSSPGLIGGQGFGQRQAGDACKGRGRDGIYLPRPHRSARAKLPHMAPILGEHRVLSLAQLVQRLQVGALQRNGQRFGKQRRGLGADVLTRGCGGHVWGSLRILKGVGSITSAQRMAGLGRARAFS